MYAQHRTFFNSKGSDICPRLAFLQDLCSAINEFKETGDNIILLLDGNTDMKNSDLQKALEFCQLREVILEKHGVHGPSTYRRNNTNTPIDGIWATPGIVIQEGGYFEYDSVFINTDHRCLWIDISFISAFGHNMPHIVKPSARRLHCRDPRLVKNYVDRLEKFITEHNLLQQSNDLVAAASYPPQDYTKDDYELIDSLRCKGIALAEKKCRKLRMGNIDYSPEIQAARLLITAWHLIQKRANGQKVSSRLLQRTLKKASLNPILRTSSLQTCQENLKMAYKQYYSLKGSHRVLRKNAMERLAEAIAEQGNQKKASIIKGITQETKDPHIAKQ